MGVNQIKGALLEYTVRSILESCGFTNPKSDGIYTFETDGLFYINGRGGAHDADIFMDPPIQIPFTNPTRILFECKAYTGNVGIPIARNVLGFRDDINSFEVVTKEHLIKRQKKIEKQRQFLKEPSITIK